MNNHQDQMWWEIQKNGGWKSLTNALSRDQEVHSQFDSFIKTFYWRFREKKEKPRGSYRPEIDFQGFKEFSNDNDSTAGFCRLLGEGTVLIYLNQMCLLGKLGMNKLITNYSADFHEINTNSIDISFDKLIHTIAHELAHAYQYTIHLKKRGENTEISQCESSGKKDQDGNSLYPQLVAEHTRFTAEIEKMITGSAEYQEFRTWWWNKESGENRPPAYQGRRQNCENCGKINPYNYCQECSQTSSEFNKLVLLIIQDSKDLATLENNWAIVKASLEYNSNKKIFWGDSQSNKIRLDNLYYTSKNALIKQNSANSSNTTQLLYLALGITVIAFIGIIFWYFWEEKPEKRESESYQ